VEDMPNGVLVRTRSLLEMRLRPKRLTEEIVKFLADLDPTPNSLRHEQRTGLT
jgi:hypothetical protein